MLVIFAVDFFFFSGFLAGAAVATAVRFGFAGDFAVIGLVLVFTVGLDVTLG